MMAQITFKVEAFWDSDAQVWVASSNDVPGLVTEASTIEVLTQKVREIIPELIVLNNIVPSGYIGSITFELISHRQELIEVAS
jgi:predicted RNase H-like HicB family nuclease